MTCPRCRCPECQAAAVNAVLRRVAVSRETESPDAFNEALRLQNADKEAWRDTVVTFDDPHATDLALAVAEEMQRGRG